MISLDFALRYGPQALLRDSPAPELHNAPQIDDEIFDRLPLALAAAARSVDNGPRAGAFYLSATASISACMDTIRIEHATNELKPPIFSFIVGPPGAGKGVCDLSRGILGCVDKLVREQSTPTGKPYLFLPANSSSRAFFDALVASGGVGIIHETEADTLASTNSQDWASLVSVMLRQAYHHENLQIARVEHQAVIEEPAIAVVLAGTPGQLTSLIPSPENGLYSRFCFLYLPQDITWRSPRPSRSNTLTKQHLGKLKTLTTDIYLALKERESALKAVFRNAHWDLGDQVFDALSRSAQTANEGRYSGMVGAVRRASVTTHRIATVLSAIRSQQRGEDLSHVSVLSVSDEDFEAGLLTALRCLDHGHRLLGLLPTSSALPRSRDEIHKLIINGAGSLFQRSTAVTLCKQQYNTSASTVDKALRELVAEKKLYRVPGKNGVYSTRLTDQMRQELLALEEDEFLDDL